jgi:thioredoxin-like negative regulator of GroEL
MNSYLLTKKNTNPLVDKFIKEALVKIERSKSETSDIAQKAGIPGIPVVYATIEDNTSKSFLSMSAKVYDTELREWLEQYIEKSGEGKSDIVRKALLLYMVGVKSGCYL